MGGQLRGTVKLAHALRVFAVKARGVSSERQAAHYHWTWGPARILIQGAPHGALRHQGQAVRLLDSHRHVKLGEAQSPVQAGSILVTEQERESWAQRFSSGQGRFDDLAGQATTVVRGVDDHAADPHHRKSLRPDLNPDDDHAGRRHQPALVVAQRDMPVLGSEVPVRSHRVKRVLLVALELGALSREQPPEFDNLHPPIQAPGPGGRRRDPVPETGEAFTPVRSRRPAAG